MSELDKATIPAVGPIWSWPDTDLPCDGFGAYYIIGYSAVGKDKYMSTMLGLGETLPKAEPEAEVSFPDYDGIIDALDRRFTVDIGLGQYRYLTNAAIIVKHCLDRRHDDGYLSRTNFRPSVEWIASLVVVDASACIETLEDYTEDRFYQRVGIWLPYAQVEQHNKTLEIIRSVRGGDTAGTAVAMPDAGHRAHQIRRSVAA